MIVITSQDLDQDVESVKKAALSEPVFILEDGKFTHVLLNIQDYQRIVGERRKITDILSMSDSEEIAFDPPRFRMALKPADLG